MSLISQSLAAWVQSHSKNSSLARATPLESVELQVAKIESNDELNASILGRLGDLGLGVGERFQYFGRAPLGEPIFICVRETVVALRLEEAALIEIVSTVVSSGTSEGSSR